MTTSTVPVGGEPTDLDTGYTNRCQAYPDLFDPWLQLVNDQLDTMFVFDWATWAEPSVFTFRRLDGPGAVRVPDSTLPGDPIRVLATCEACGRRVATGINALDYLTFEAAHAAALEEVNRTSRLTRLATAVYGCAH